MMPGQFTWLDSTVVERLEKEQCKIPREVRRLAATGVVVGQLAKRASTTTSHALPYSDNSSSPISSMLSSCTRFPIRPAIGAQFLTIDNYQGLRRYFKPR